MTADRFHHRFTINASVKEGTNGRVYPLIDTTNAITNAFSVMDHRRQHDGAGDGGAKNAKAKTDPFRSPPMLLPPKGIDAKKQNGVDGNW